MGFYNITHKFKIPPKDMTTSPDIFHMSSYSVSLVNIHSEILCTVVSCSEFLSILIKTAYFWKI